MKPADKQAIRKALGKSTSAYLEQINKASGKPKPIKASAKVIIVNHDYRLTIP
ncbi:hypothetical protein [Thiothrix nivea]|uniref:Uncharacterized protein n=1 Tax=Thiothrix nivea (strain ATCC 35100 / DSM 5205 / JP2) TaxID=870187 RepID=A0A656HE70_THINJ|nr:hypothetical protein [Thiothrix nivea]EIJ33335.1 hypothetical protein Thini_0698 [Thiothrix nivea DSM 5205]